MNDGKIKLVCVVGPTASGKTSLGIELAKRFDGEIISADSMQIYKGIHIASAAPDTDEMQGIPHHLIEILSPDEACTVADYVRMADECIRDIASRGKMPVIVGGTGLYINSLIDGISFIPEQTDMQLRQELTAEMESVGAEEMLRRLALFDPETAARLHPNDSRRIIRAFEIYRSTGKTQTQANEESRGESPYDVLMIGLSCLDRQRLYDRIDMRVDVMLDKGLLDEARKATEISGGAVQAIGHKELYGYLNGDKSKQEAADNLRRATRRYAKRQLTWFRRDERINWIYTDETADTVGEAVRLIEEWRN